MMGNHIFNYKKFNESLEWSGNFMGVELGELASHDDGYLKMVVKDVDFEGTDMILTVEVSEVNNSDYKGNGIFKYVESEIETLSGDITPLKMDGILLDIFEDDEGIVYEFINRLVDQLT